ncbi:MAG TPA: MBL fold metallo-hydrolase [Burkholderiaceae bacterium]|jgi:glyoxylase-like metal-dependent hydrolase (beta-lactamase superfamily II)/8-oxo-dGTP pyrophosphatase MutT (NUDIX family)|nr:MBL fold metallo-hydrolase [Burkholderiaceae bacterium]
MQRPAGDTRAQPTVATPRPAATVIVARDGADGMEVLLLKRAERSGDRSSGAYVFPGGTLDAGDRDLHDRCVGLDDAAASVRLRLPAGGLDYYVAAIRECFEEAGILFACDAAGNAVAIDVGPEELERARAAIRRGESTLRAFCEAHRIYLAADRLAYHSHWLTPRGLPKRFDTRFFVAVLPSGQSVSIDRVETLEHRWIRPRDALAGALDARLPNATQHTLAALADFPSARACFEHAQALRDIALIEPRIGVGAGGPQPVMPEHPAYAEIGRLDPDGQGIACCELVPGRLVRLSPRVYRVTAPNGNLMTGPGTNTYFVGDPQGRTWAVIDPGPDDADHLAAILAGAPGPISRIFVTHTHKDHSPLARELKARTGAQLAGMRPLHTQWQDAGFAPDVTLRDGERIVLGAHTTLRVIHTPGHASNHLCYLLEEEKTLFTGDHVMQGSTVVINPPDGDMAAYLASLRALLAEDLEWLAPGHGFLIARPHEAIERLIAHRAAREARVLRALAGRPGASVDELLAEVYAETPAPLLPVARRSLTAHLLKLAAEGRAREEGGRWRTAVG